MADTSRNTYYEARIQGEDGTDLGTLTFTAPTVLSALNHLAIVVPQLEEQLGEEPFTIHLARVAPPQPDEVPEPGTLQEEEPAAGF